MVRSRTISANKRPSTRSRVPAQPSGSEPAAAPEDEKNTETPIDTPVEIDQPEGSDEAEPVDAAPETDEAIPVEVGSPEVQPESTPEPDQGDPFEPVEEDVPDIPAHVTLSRLDADRHTSLAQSLSLHMLSEHDVTGALHTYPSVLEEEHELLHQEHGHDHDAKDLRFRPEPALAAALSRVVVTTPPGAAGESA